MTLLFAILFAVAPSVSQTSWMRPDAFHLTIGMRKAAAVKALADGGVTLRDGDHAGQMIADITPTKSLTVEFAKERLQSIRFELFTMSDVIGPAFEEEKKSLRESFGAPKAISSKSMVIYNHTLPNVMAVMTVDKRQGLGTLAVRYFDPATASRRQ
ncbi:MAG TPA: hypothetical protein VGJ82_03390 [Thermoanaerobaculia bacterium]|jgi:hypothetical protein